MDSLDAYRNGDLSVFCRSAVLFLDLLGTVVSGLGQDARAQLTATQAALERARDWGDSDPKDTPAVVRWFSDNLGMAYPIIGAVEEEDALSAIIDAAGQHQLALILHGFVARGAISLDDFFADENMIYGPALNRAVALEKAQALYPRVVLDEASAVAARRHLIDYYGASATAPYRSTLAVDGQGVIFVNYLGVGLEYDEEQAPLSYAYLAQHRDLVRARLMRFDGQPSIHDKYRWLAAYHDWYIDALTQAVANVPVEQLLVRQTRPFPTTFRRFADEISAPADPWEGPG